MLGEEFETWSTDPLLDTTLVTVGKHITILDYLEDRPSCFTKFPEGGTEESNKMLVELDTAGIISKTNDRDLPDLIDLEAERASKRKEKVERRRQRKINLVQAIVAGVAQLSPVVSVRCPLSSPVTFVNSLSGASTGGAPSSLVAGGGPSSTVLSRLLSLVACGGLLSTVSGCPLSLVADDSPSSTVLGRLLFLVTYSSPLSAVLGHSLSFVVGNDVLFPVLDHLSYAVAIGGPCLLLLVVVFCFLYLLLAPGHYS